MNELETIKHSRFNHYLIDNEFNIKIQTYETIYTTLDTISQSIDELDKIRRVKYYIIIFTIILSIIAFFIGASLK